TRRIAGSASASPRGGSAARGRRAVRRTAHPSRAASPGGARAATRARPAPAPAARRHARGTTRPTRARPRRRASGRGPALGDPLDLLPRSRVHDVALREPGAPGLADAELDVRLRSDLVAVGVDDELQPGLARRTRVDVAQVEPVRLRVELEERPRLERLLDDALDIEVDSRAFVQLAPREVADAVDVRVVHRREDALERVLLACGVHRRHNPVESRGLLVGHVERAVGPDVHLDTSQDAERRDLLAQRLDLRRLSLEPPLAQIVRVICDRVVLVPARDRGAHHLLERVLAVGRPVRVRVQVTSEVVESNELRKFAVARRHELAAVLAQLARDELVAEESVQLLLAPSRERLARLGVLDAVLRDGELAPNRRLAKRDVVILRAREVLEQVAVRLRRDDPEIEAEAVLRD